MDDSVIWNWSGDGAADAVFDKAAKEHDEKQAANNPWVHGYERWDPDLVGGEMRLRFAEGRIVTAPVQVIGSFSYEDQTWQWAWDNPSVNRLLTQDVYLCRKFGEQYKLPQYTNPIFSCSEEDARGFGAVAMHLAGATGVFRQPEGVIRVSTIFGPLTSHKAN